MTTPITPDERAAMRTLADAATEGPWESTQDKCWGEKYPSLNIQRVYEYTDYDPARAGCEPLDAEDVAFIASARTAVPRLLDALDAAEADLDGFANVVSPWKRRALDAEAEVARLRAATSPAWDEEAAALAVVRDRLPVKPHRDALAAAIRLRHREMGSGVETVTVDDYESADAVLSLLPGRSEAEVKAEGIREAAGFFRDTLHDHGAAGVLDRLAAEGGADRE